MMSDNNDINLLDDDLEDDIDYDLGNEDEDRLLADDYDIQVPSDKVTYQQKHDAKEKNFLENDEPAEDDILDLGVTDGLDDLDSEIQESADISQQKLINESAVFEKEVDSTDAEADTTDANDSTVSNIVESNNSNAGEKSVTDTRNAESEEEEESEIESRDRFKSERTNIVPLKSSKTFGNIPDNLDSVIPSEEITVKKKWQGKKGWGSRQSGPNKRGGINQRYHQHQHQQHFQPKPYHSFQNSGGHFQQGQQPPQKILINPHFRGAVQAHSDARLIWDREAGVNNGFSQRMMGNEDFNQIPPLGGFEGQFQQNTNPPSALLSDNLLQQHHHQNQNYPPPLHAAQQQSQYYNENYMEQPPSHGPVPTGSEPWLNPNMLSQPPPQTPPDNFFLPPPREPLLFPPPQHGPQQQFNPFQDQGPRFPPPGNFVPPPDIHMQGLFRVPPPNHMGPGGRFRQPGHRFQNMNMKRRANYQGGPPNGPKRMVPPKQQNVTSGTQHSQQTEVSTPQQKPANVLPMKRMDSTPRRKKRMPDMSNLHEVQTVDTLPVKEEASMSSSVAAPGTTGTDVEQEDEETREYRRKIEEQKRMREKVLQAKELRRKMAALEKQRLLKEQHTEKSNQQQPDATVNEIGSGMAQPSQVEPPMGNAIATIVNRNTVQPSPKQGVQGLRKRPGMTRVGTMGAFGIQRHQKQHLYQQQQLQVRRVQQHAMQKGPVATQQSMQKIPVVRKKVGVTGNFKATSGTTPARIVRAPNQQASSTVAMPKRAAVVGKLGQQQQSQVRKVVLRGVASSSSVQLVGNQPQQQQQQQQQQRLVIQKAGSLQTQQLPASQARTVVVNQMEQLQPRTSKSVLVENLSVDTDEMKLRRMCLRVGTVEKVQMQPQNQRAIITFANPTSAGNFLNRYQRKIVDLSLIQVSVLPERT